MKKEETKKANTPPSKGWGIAGFILSLISIVSLFVIGWFVGLIFGIIALIFCIIQYKKGKTGLAKAGLILSIIGIALSIILVIATVVVHYIVSSSIESSADKLNQAAQKLNQAAQNLP